MLLPENDETARMFWWSGDIPTTACCIWICSCIFDSAGPRHFPDMSAILMRTNRWYGWMSGYPVCGRKRAFCVCFLVQGCIEFGVWSKRRLEISVRIIYMLKVRARSKSHGSRPNRKELDRTLLLPPLPEYGLYYSKVGRRHIRLHHVPGRKLYLLAAATTPMTLVKILSARDLWQILNTALTQFKRFYFAK
jgi:hypothetical protein